MPTRLLIIGAVSVVCIHAFAQTSAPSTMKFGPITNTSNPLYLRKHRLPRVEMTTETLGSQGAPGFWRGRVGTTTGPQRMIGPIMPAPRPRQTPEYDEEGYPKPRIRLIEQQPGTSNQPPTATSR